MDYINNYDSPLGKILLSSNGKELTGLWFYGGKFFAEGLFEEKEEKTCPVFDKTKHWLDIYFDGKIPDFTPDIAPKGTKFMHSVWEILSEIPYGKTLTYGDIAKTIAIKKGIQKMSAQAIGNAVGHNKISIIIPCHRVLGANGNLTGYAGGIKRKIKLLELEKVNTKVLSMPKKETFLCDVL